MYLEELQKQQNNEKKKLLLPEDIKLYMIMIATFCYLQRENSKVFKFRNQLFL